MAGELNKFLPVVRGGHRGMDPDTFLKGYRLPS